MVLLDNGDPDCADLGGVIERDEQMGCGMIKTIVMAVGVYTLGMCVVRIVLALMGDRTGNSGRYKRWDEEDD